MARSRSVSLRGIDCAKRIFLLSRYAGAKGTTPLHPLAGTNRIVFAKPSYAWQY